MLKKIHFKQFMILLIISFLVIINSRSASASSDVIRVVFPNQVGLSEVYGKDSYGGYTFDYLEKIAQFTGWKYEFITFPDLDVNESIVAAMKMVEKGEADIVGGLLQDNNTKDKFDFPQSHYGLVYTTLSILESNITINEINFMNQATPLKVALLEKATQRNEETITYLDSIKANYELKYYSSLEEQIDALKKGDCDALSRVTLSFYPGTKTIAEYAPRPFYFATTKGNTAITEKIDQTLLSINRTFPYFQYETYQKYFGNTSGGFTIYDNEVDFVLKGYNIKALCMPDSAPYCYLERNEAKGILVEFLKTFAKNLGFTVEFDFIDKDSSIEKININNYTCVLGTPISEYYTVNSKLINSNYLLSTTYVKFSQNSQSLTNQTGIMALQKGTVVSGDINARIKYYNSSKEVIKAVMKGDADFGYVNKLSLEYYSRYYLNTFAFSPVSSVEQNIGIGINNCCQNEFISLLNRFITSFDKSEIQSYLLNVTSEIKSNSFKYLVVNNPLFLFFIIVIILFSTSCLVLLLFIKKKNDRYNKELVMANNAKTAFLSRVSHDMRTPLNGIIGSINMIKESKSKEEIDSNLNNLSSSSDYLLNLINDTLVVAKIESGKLFLCSEAYDPQEVFDELHSLIVQSIKDKNIELEWPTDLDFEKNIMIDKTRILQLFMNLLSNSIKFSHKGGKIKLDYKIIHKSEKEANVEFTIEDHGVGMSKDFLPHIFESFTQEDGSLKNNLNGTGLGMGISKKIIEIMGGTIRVESEKNVGTSYIFNLIIPLTDREIKSKTQNINPNILEGKRVLICEDNNLNLIIITNLLRKHGLIIDTAEDGQIGLDKFIASKEFYYDLILMDIRMPIKDGIETTKAIRQLNRSDAKTIKIIAMTANAFEEDKNISLNAGMNAHLTKPINKDIVINTIISTLSN